MTTPPTFPRNGAVRGPSLRLDPHIDHIDSLDDLPGLCHRLRLESPERPLAADLFSGAGGLSLGLQMAGVTVVMGCDINPEAAETHAHHFPGLSLNADLGDPATVQKVGETLRAAGIDILGGGPPCQPFSKAGRAKIRHRVQHHLRDPYDERRDLWQSFVEIAEIARPRAVIMENVPDMALDAEMFILRSIAKRLEDADYSVDFRIVATSDYGVPQFRQRLIMVALRDRYEFTWPEPTTTTTLGQAIGDLPEVEGGWVDEEATTLGLSYDRPLNDFQFRMRTVAPPADPRKGSRPRHAGRSPRRSRGLQADGFADEVLRSAGRASSVPIGHFRRQIQAAGLGRPVEDDHRSHCQGRLLVHPSKATPDHHHS